MPTIGVLSKNKFVPRVGDVLRDTENGISWECVRANKVSLPKTGEAMRYGVLVGFCRDVNDGNTPIARTFDDLALPFSLLAEIDEIVRQKNGKPVVYRRNPQGNYAEV